MDATNPPEQSAPIRLPDVSGEKHKEVIEKLFAAKLQREAAEQRFIKVRAENDDLQEELGQLQAQYDVLRNKYELLMADRDTHRQGRVYSGPVTYPGRMEGRTKRYAFLLWIALAMTIGLTVWGIIELVDWL